MDPAIHTYRSKREKLLNRYPSVADLAQKAKKRIPVSAWAYLETGTGSEKLLDRNISDIQDVSFIPRFCKGLVEPSLDCTLLDVSYRLPFGIAPIGMAGFMWPGAEKIMATSAAAMDIPFCLSTVSCSTPEKIGPIAGEKPWFQLYPPKKAAIRKDLLQRAQENGFSTLVVTADVPIPSRRERTKKAGLKAPPILDFRLIGQGVVRPSWSYQTLLHGMPKLATVAPYTKAKRLDLVSQFVDEHWRGALDWDYCKALRSEWEGPMIIKGILHPKDAKKAIKIGFDAIVVSNHGGRQFDGAISSLSALKNIYSEIGDRVPLIFDSGIRSGLDIIRAIHSGASFVLLGRAFMYGVAALGPLGAYHVAEILKEDLHNNMVQLACPDIASLRKL